MALGIRVFFRATDGAVQGEQTIHEFPVRLGRNAMNDVQIAHPFVSDFHCAIDLVDGRLYLRDLNSKNGIRDRDRKRVPAGASVALEAIGSPFSLGGAVEVSVEVLDANLDFRGRPSGARGSVLGNEAVLGVGRSDEIPPLPPLLTGAPLRGSMGDSLPALAPLPGVSLPHPEVRARTPALPEGPEGASRHTQHLSMSTEILALAGLRELAGSLVPGVPLETTGDVARLLTKLHDAVEVFCRCFVVLRDSHLQALAAAGLGEPESSGLHRSESAARVAAARDPSTLAAALLDWHNHDFDAPRVIEKVFLDIVAGDASMVEGVMRGVDALMRELSPATIEAEVKARGGVGAVLGQHRVLWRTYEERFAAVSDDGRRFEFVFGPEFAASYKEYRLRQSKDTASWPGMP